MQLSKILTVVALALFSLSAGKSAMETQRFGSRGLASPNRAPASGIEIPAVVPGRHGATYDLGTLKNVGVETAGVCNTDYKPDSTTPSGKRVKMLGVAFVYMGPSNGFSVLGHAAERFVYCFEDRIIDQVYEYSKPDPLMMGLDEKFEREYGISLKDYSDDEKKKILNSLYVTITTNPANYYAMEQFQVHRTIYETWFDIDGDSAFKMLSANAERYQSQARKIKAHEELPVYEIKDNNCSTPIRDDLRIVNPAYLERHHPLIMTPGFLYKLAKHSKAKKTIVYPSQRLLRLIRLKQQGKSRLFEGFVPLSKTLKHAFPGSWTLLHDDGTSPWRKLLLTPIYGAVNLAAGTVSTTYGLATAPVRLVGKITKSKKLAKVGLGRLRHGIADMIRSLSEVFTLRLRYPTSTPWTAEEIDFFQGIQQNSALLEYMRTEWEKAPLVIQGEASDAAPDPTPEAPAVPDEEKLNLIAPDTSALD